jgi:iron complex outermembrane receptor protein
MREDLETIGDEAVVPKADTTAYAAFFYEELGFDRVKLLFGGRYDTEDVDPGCDVLDPAFFPLTVEGLPIVGPGVDRKDYSGFSGAIGAIFNPEGRWSVAANVTRNFKAPAGEEVFSFGPHIATQTFEVGNGDLDEETSIGYDLSFRWNLGRFRGEITEYRTDFSDYIFLEETANDPNNPVLVGGQPFDVEPPVVAVYSQADALFQGIEAHADVALLPHLHLEFVGDTVRATNDETDEPFAHIPPMRAGLGIDWDTDLFGVGGEARYASKQNRIDPEIETATSAYTVYNIFGHIQFPSGPVVHRFTARVDNLTDRLYRNHVSIVKDLVPQPGRTARVGYTLVF